LILCTKPASSLSVTWQSTRHKSLWCQRSSSTPAESSGRHPFSVRSTASRRLVKLTSSSQRPAMRESAVLSEWARRWSDVLTCDWVVRGWTRDRRRGPAYSASSVNQRDGRRRDGERIHGDLVCTPQSAPEPRMGNFLRALGLVDVRSVLALEQDTGVLRPLKGPQATRRSAAEPAQCLAGCLAMVTMAFQLLQIQDSTAAG
jgi:hypothetical protein